MLNADGRKPIRCGVCGRRLLPVRPLQKLADRAALWLIGHGRWRAAQRIWARTGSL